MNRIEGENNVVRDVYTLNEESPFISGDDIHNVCRDLSLRGFVALLILTGIGIYRFFSQGWQFLDIAYAALAFVSMVILVSYPMILLDVHRKGKSWLALFALLGFLPYGLGCYVFFYEGIWQSITALRIGDHILSSIVRGVFFIFLGFSSVSAIHKLWFIRKKVETL